MLPNGRVPAITAPDLVGLRQGRVRVRLSSGVEDVRTVLLGEGKDAWSLWARDTRFALERTSFLDIGDAVYRTETIDRVDPMEGEASSSDTVYQALQATIVALRMIRDAVQITDHLAARRLAAELLDGLEQAGVEEVDKFH